MKTEPKSVGAFLEPVAVAEVMGIRDDDKFDASGRVRCSSGTTDHGNHRSSSAKAFEKENDNLLAKVIGTYMPRGKESPVRRSHKSALKIKGVSLEATHEE